MKNSLFIKSVALSAVFFVFVLFSPGICAPVLSISVTGGDWDIGEIFQNKSTSTASDFWEIKTSEDSEGYKISVDISVSSGTHSPSQTGDSGENIFLLREGDSEGLIISTTPVQLTEIIGEDTYDLGLYFKAPSENSSPTSESLILTLYAEWEAYIFDITLDDQGGSGGSGTVTVSFGEPMPSAIKPQKTGFIFDGYYDETEGAGTKYYNADMTSAKNWDKGPPATLYAKWRTPVVGETGQANGWVFYDKGEYTNGWRYMEVAPTRVWTPYQVYQWAYDPELFEGVGGTLTDIGTGKENTDIINLALSEGNFAALMADTWTVTYGGREYDDWFLPSQDELMKIAEELFMNDIGNLTTANTYWSSTQYSASDGYNVEMLDFGEGKFFNSSNTEKHWSGIVRPARRF